MAYRPAFLCFICSRYQSKSLGELLTITVVAIVITLPPSSKCSTPVIDQVK